VIIGTAGHIDHGKTALVKALTGIDADRLPEEKRRGITIDLGFAPLQLDGIGTVGMIDVPGHEDFVRSMLVGASGIDLGLLVVAADEGVMPQTREHLLILGLLGIPRIAVALTKSDLVNSEWIDLVRTDVLALFEEAGAEKPVILACSSKTGEGLKQLRSALTQLLESANTRSTDDVFRLPVDRAFTVKGTGTVVTGTVWSGALGADESVRVLPAARTARARRIEQHGKPSDRARAGGRAAIALAGIDVGEVPAESSSILTHADVRWSRTPDKSPRSPPAAPRDSHTSSAPKGRGVSKRERSRYGSAVRRQTCRTSSRRVAHTSERTTFSSCWLSNKLWQACGASSRNTR